MVVKMKVMWGDNADNNVHSSTWRPGCRVLRGALYGIEKRFVLRCRGS